MKTSLNSNGAAGNGRESKHSSADGGALQLWSAWTRLIIQREDLIRTADLDVVSSRRGRRGPNTECEDQPRKIAEEELAKLSVEISALRTKINHIRLDPIREVCAPANLGSEEIEIVAFLICTSISPKFADYFEEPKIGLLLRHLAPEASTETLLRWRRHFHPKSPLASSGIIQLAQSRMGFAEPDLLSMRVEADRRTVNQVIGDDTSYSHFSAFLRIDDPHTSIASVILPEDMKEKVLTTAQAWLRRRARGVVEPLGMIFYGPTGTGKTMLARAVSASLGLPLVQPEISPAMRAKLRGNYMQVGMDDLLPFLLREARLLGGMVLLDECDDSFEAGGLASQALLVELERNGCFVILATNSPSRLDRALDRRMTLRVPFGLPALEERRLIWRGHLADAGVGAADELARTLAPEYHFSGGYIANAVKVAALRAEAPDLVTIEALRDAAAEQKIRMNGGWELPVEIGSDALPPMSAACADRFARAEEVARRRLGLGKPIRIHLRGDNEETLRLAAGALARRLGLTIAYPALYSSDEDSHPLHGHRSRRGRGSFADETKPPPLAVQIACLPGDCAVAITGAEDQEELEGVCALLNEPGLYFFLAPLKGYVNATHLSDGTITLEPPDLEHRKKLAERILVEEKLDPALAEFVASTPMQELEIRAVIVRAACQAEIEGRPQPGKPDFDHALGTAREQTAPPILFGR